MTRFDAARRDAVMSSLLRSLRGQPVDLLPFETVRDELRLSSFVDRGIREVPLDKIVGSLGRVQEFNRAFLPREEALRDRWREIWELAEGPKGFPPIELFQVGDAYFVVDGHHRVSVARAMGTPALEARVKEFQTRVLVDSHTTLEEVLLKRGLAEFLAATGLEPGGPEAFRLTVAHGYEHLVEHIRVHRYYRGIEEGREIPWDEAVRSWRDRVYLPTVEIIRRGGILNAFPGRTEADLYLFTMDHLAKLRERYGIGDVTPERAVDELARSGRRNRRLSARVRRWLRRSHGGSDDPPEAINEPKT